jgi:hypothetical protein
MVLPYDAGGANGPAQARLHGRVAEGCRRPGEPLSDHRHADRGQGGVILVASTRLDRRSAHEVGQEIARLRDLDASVLRLRWREVTGKPAAVGLKGELLIRALAYAIQEKAFGGLSLTAAKRLQAIAREGKTTVDTAPSAKPSARRKLMPGTRLIREWQGVMHEVIVIPDGFLWQGTTYASLSTVAKAITGTSWNGWVFFGAKPAAKKVKRTDGTIASSSAPHAVDWPAGSDAHA